MTTASDEGCHVGVAEASARSRGYGRLDVRGGDRVTACRVYRIVYRLLDLRGGYSLRDVDTSDGARYRAGHQRAYLSCARSSRLLPLPPRPVGQRS